MCPHRPGLGLLAFAKGFIIAGATSLPRSARFASRAFCAAEVWAVSALLVVLGDVRWAAGFWPLNPSLVGAGSWTLSEFLLSQFQSNVMLCQSRVRQAYVLDTKKGEQVADLLPSLLLISIPCWPGVGFGWGRRLGSAGAGTAPCLNCSLVRATF